MFLVQTLMARLKAKRFRQIFHYLDQDQDGIIDLLDLTTGEEGLMETLDPEVRADVEAAAHVLAAHQPTPRQRCDLDLCLFPSAFWVLHFKSAAERPRPGSVH